MISVGDYTMISILSRIKYINNTDSYINLFAFYGMLLDFSMKLSFPVQ